MKNKSRYLALGIIAILLVGIYLVYTGSSDEQPLRKTRESLERADYLAIDTLNKVYLGADETTITVTTRYDNLNDHFSLKTLSTGGEEEIDQEFYRLGSTTYRKIGDSWTTDEVLSGGNRYNTLDAITRLNKVESIEQQSDGSGNFYLSDISQNDAQKIINSLFINNILDSTDDITIDKATTRWYINEETQQLNEDIRVIEAQIDGTEVRIVMQNTYTNYNVPFEITVPQEALDAINDQENSAEDNNPEETLPEEN